MKKLLIIISIVVFTMYSIQGQPQKAIEPYVALQFNVGTTLGQMRMAPVDIKGNRFFLLIYSEMRGIDPYEGSFHFPTNTVKIALYDFTGNLKWKKELPHVIPGTWFLPVFAFDLNDDGVDEIYLVNNKDEDRPFNTASYVLQCLDSNTGKIINEWPWPRPTHNQANSYKWRFFIMGGYVNDTPVLLTSQGTYRSISLQAWNSDMTLRWEKKLPDVYHGPVDLEKMINHYKAINQDYFDGPRGSHHTPIIDTNNDGIDEVLIGERCIDLDKGSELFIMDHNQWDNHSDVVQPIWNNKDNRWYFWTCREKGDDGRRSRAVFFNDKGDPLWSIKEKRGHFHHGWAANIGINGETLVLAARYAINMENAFDFGRPWEYWVFDAYSGEEVSVPFNPLGRPFDFNGDGIHEIVVGNEIVDFTGKIWGNIGEDANIINLHKTNNKLQGEQILAWYPDGTVKLWADKNANESEKMREIYKSKYYQQNLKLTGVGYNPSKFILVH
jgi:hypothetical protein